MCDNFWKRTAREHALFVSSWVIFKYPKQARVWKVCKKLIEAFFDYLSITKFDESLFAVYSFLLRLKKIIFFKVLPLVTFYCVILFFTYICLYIFYIYILFLAYRIYIINYYYVSNCPIYSVYTTLSLSFSLREIQIHVYVIMYIYNVNIYTDCIKIMTVL